MPKLRASEQQLRESALMCAVARACAANELSCDKDVADALGITARRYMYRKGQNFQGMPISEFGRMARRLRLTGREVCAALGVPFVEEERA